MQNVSVDLLKWLFVVFAAVAVPAAGTARAAEDKSAYTLLNPTPAHLMRELSPDRPDVTESPYTVDAGHFQVELSFVEWVKGGGEELSVLPSNLKIGLTNTVDLQLVVNPYLRSRSAGQTDVGHGDLQVRVKFNLLGNDSGDVAIGIMPFVQIPVGADAFSNDDHVEGGVIIPVAVSLPGDWDLGLMAEFDFVRDGGGGYDTLFVHTVTIGHEIIGPLGGYMEYVGVSAVDGDSDYSAALGVGLNYRIDSNTMLDAGVYTGLTSAADDLRLFVGMTWRH
jgi:hypothetical protein